MITFAFLLLFGIPGFFLIAVVWRTFQDWQKSRVSLEPERIPTEPIVLMVLGFAFLVYNEQFVPIAAHVAQEQMRQMRPDFPLAVVGAAYGVSSVVLVASFAKAFWTHLNLEDGNWGSISDYRRNIWPKPKTSVIEFLLRVLIATVVVLLQKQIASLQSIPNIEVASSWKFASDGDIGRFLPEYMHWMAKTAIFGMMFFVLISIWLGIAFFYNKAHKNVWGAFLGTITFAGPGLVLCWALNYLATGSLSPAIENHGQPDPEVIMAMSGLLIFLSVIVILNLLFTIWQARAVFAPVHSEEKN